MSLLHPRIYRLRSTALDPEAGGEASLGEVRDEAGEELKKESGDNG